MPRTTPMTAGGMARPALRWLAAAVAAMLMCAVARADDAPDPVVAQRGTVTVTASQVRQMLAMADPETRAQMQRDPQLLLQRVRDRLLQLVLLEKAHREQWDARPDVIYRAEQAKDSAIAESYLAAQVPLAPDYPSDKEIAAAYEANKAKLMLPRQYHLAQILIAVPQDAPATADAAAPEQPAPLHGRP